MPRAAPYGPKLLFNHWWWWRFMSRDTLGEHPADELGAWWVYEVTLWPGCFSYIGMSSLPGRRLRQHLWSQVGPTHERLPLEYWLWGGFLDRRAAEHAERRLFLALVAAMPGRYFSMGDLEYVGGAGVRRRPPAWPQGASEMGFGDGGA